MQELEHWSREAEQGVIGCLLFDNDCADDIIPTLAAEDFYAEAHRAIYLTTRAILSAKQPADLITVIDAMRANGTLDEVGGPEYINACISSVSSSRMARRYAEVVKERAQHRRLVDRAEEAREIAAGQGTVAEKLDRLMGLFAPINGEVARREPQLLADVILRRTQRLDDIAAGKKEFVMATGTPSLDHALGGGLRPGKLVVLAARPGIGKSSLSQTLSEDIAISHEVPTLFLSQEMAVEELADRAIARRARVPYDALQLGKLDDDQWGRVLEAYEAVARFEIRIDDQPALRIEQIKAKARSIKGLRLLVVDYIQLAVGDGDNRTQQVGSITRALKQLAMEMGIAVIALSQLNREVDKRPLARPIMSDLRDSGEVEQDADIILFLWKPREGLIAMDIAKNRGGPVGRCIGLHFDGSLQRWGESTEDPLAVADTGRKRIAL